MRMGAVGLARVKMRASRASAVSLYVCMCVCMYIWLCMRAHAHGRCWPCRSQNARLLWACMYACMYIWLCMCANRHGSWLQCMGQNVHPESRGYEPFSGINRHKSSCVWLTYIRAQPLIIIQCFESLDPFVCLWMLMRVCICTNICTHPWSPWFWSLDQFVCLWM